MFTSFTRDVYIVKSEKEGIHDLCLKDSTQHTFHTIVEAFCLPDARVLRLSPQSLWRKLVVK